MKRARQVAIFTLLVPVRKHFDSAGAPERRNQASEYKAGAPLCEGMEYRCALYNQYRQIRRSRLLGSRLGGRHHSMSKTITQIHVHRYHHPACILKQRYLILTGSA
jgi:hypothetical protein